MNESAPEPSVAVACRGLRFAHPGSPSAIAIDDLSLPAHSTTAVIGPSGSGKTTLLHLIAGILTPDAGTITIDGVEISKASPARRRRTRLEKIGLVFQEFELLDHLTVRENIALPFAIDRSLATAERIARITPLATRLGIGPQLARRPRHLSHGERQRVAIARALLVEPRLLLADEPTGNLDPTTGREVLDGLFEEARRIGTTVLLVTHDHSLLERFDRVIDLAEVSVGADRGGAA